MAYNIIFYEKQDGTSEIWDFLESLRHKSVTTMIMYYFIHFVKKTNKTPRREITRAKSERDDYLSRKGGKQL